VRDVISVQYIAAVVT